MITDNENLDKTEKSLPTGGNYDSTLKKLNEILESIEKQEGSLDGLLSNVNQANALVQACREKLRSIESSVNQIL